jgi:anti-anti-sigma factor
MENQQPLAEIKYKPRATILTILPDYLMDEAAIGQLRDTIEPIIMEKPTLPLIIDFNNVRALCSGAIGYLVALKQRIEARQGRLIICCVQDKIKGSSNDKFIYEIFKVVKLDRYFEMRPSVDSALLLLK